MKITTAERNPDVELFTQQAFCVSRNILARLMGFLFVCLFVFVFCYLLVLFVYALSSDVLLSLS